MSLQKNVVLNITETRLTTAVLFTNPSRRSYRRVQSKSQYSLFS